MINKNILYHNEITEKWIVKNSKNGYEVYKDGFTHATRKHTVYFSDQEKSFKRAKEYADILDKVNNNG